MLTRRRNSKRLDVRGRGGRFAKPTLERVAGVRALVCPHCRGLRVLERGADAPTNCLHCGSEIEAGAWQ